MAANNANFPLTLDTFIRDLPTKYRSTIYSRLDVRRNWELLAEQIPKDIVSISYENNNFSPRYTEASLDAFARAGSKPRGSPANQIFKDLGTKNTTVKHLIIALHKADLKGIAELLENDLVLDPLRNVVVEQEESPHSAFVEGSGSGVESITKAKPSSDSQKEESRFESITKAESSSESQKEDLARKITPGEDAPIDVDYFSSMINRIIKYDDLEVITNNFDRKHLREGGRLVGEGGFGDVFFGKFSCGTEVAVKRLRNEDDQENSEKLVEVKEQLEAEIKTLSSLSHPHVVNLLGFSPQNLSQNNEACLVYEYLPQGSLEERLAMRFNTPALTVAQRISISQGTAEGISFLHKNGIVHRDIKSANILLDKDFQPKIGDFATARVIPETTLKDTFKFDVTKVIGTAAYLAPEVHDFEATPKLDSYSYGVILLEIITGLPVLDDMRKHRDLKVHVANFCYCSDDIDKDSDDEESEESGCIHDLVDASVSPWPRDLVEAMYKLSSRCLEPLAKRRPNIRELLPDLSSLSTKTFVA